MIIAEVERPETGIAKRRIRFWDRLGFKLNKYAYTQPAYSKDKNPVPRFLISYPEEISKSRYIEIEKDIHTKVYGCKNLLKLCKS